MEEVRCGGDGGIIAMECIYITEYETMRKYCVGGR